MGIKVKLRLSFIFLVVLSALGGIYSSSLFYKASNYIDSKGQLANIYLALKDARTIEKDFLLEGRKQEVFLKTGTTKDLRAHDSLMHSAKSSLEQLKQHDLIQDFYLQPAVDEIKMTLVRYDQRFDKLISLYFQRGFKDYGLEGTLRDDVHSLQASIGLQEKVYAYSLRRHEKDFMLRKDLKYLDRLKFTADEFTNYLTQASAPHITPAYREEKLKTIRSYVNKFEKLVNLEKLIGLNEQSGLLEEMSLQAGAIKPLVESLITQVDQKNAQLERRASVIVLLSILVPLLIGILMSIFYARRISDPLILLDNITQEVVKGVTNVSDKLSRITSKDEIGRLAKNFGVMLKNQEKQMQHISEKNDALQAAAEEDQKRQWAAEGLAHFSDILKQGDDLNELSYQIISSLVKYLEANQGGIFFIDDLEKRTKMELSASFAYNRRKFLKKDILPGEGIIGSLWKEGNTTYLKDVPGDYVNVTSGLGESTPRELVVVPIKIEETVLGAIEVATFQPFEKHQIEFVEKVADRIGVSFQAIKMQQHTKMLLETTQAQAEELRAQEEEMRQNLEELSATQEEMNRNNNELIRQKESIETHLKVYESIITKLYNGIIVTDEHFIVREANKHTLDQLQTDMDQLREMSVNDILDGISVEELMDKLSNDAHFILHKTSGQHTITFKNKWNKTMKVKMVVAAVDKGGQTGYAFLFRKVNDELDRRLSRRKMPKRL